MTWEYKVSTGVLSHNGVFVANCYSGAGESKDKPECESQRNRGPIPRGIYFIAGWNNHKSAEAIILEPIAGTIPLVEIIFKFTVIKKASRQVLHQQVASL